MYNGVGLPTPRGSGTSGYVQKNIAHIQRPKTIKEFRKELAAIKANPPKPPKKPNSEIIEHEQKRQIEIQLIKFAEKMKEEGVEEDEIERRVQSARTHLYSKLKDAPLMSQNSSHHKALEKERDLEKLKQAFKIPQDYKPGAAFDFEAIEEERLKKQAEKRMKKLQDKILKAENEIRMQEEERRKLEEPVMNESAPEASIQVLSTNKTHIPAPIELTAAVQKLETQPEEPVKPQESPARSSRSSSSGSYSSSSSSNSSEGSYSSSGSSSKRSSNSVSSSPRRSRRSRSYSRSPRRRSRSSDRRVNSKDYDRSRNRNYRSGRYDRDRRYSQSYRKRNYSSESDRFHRDRKNRRDTRDEGDRRESGYNRDRRDTRDEGDRRESGYNRDRRDRGQTRHNRSRP